MDYWDSSTWGETLPDGTTVVHGARRYPLNSAISDNTSVNPKVDPQYQIQASDIPNITKDYIKGIGETAGDVGNEIIDHPGTIAAGIVGPEFGIPAGIAAGIGGSLIDADYNQSPKDIIKNALISGLINGATGLLKVPELDDAALASAVKGNPLSRSIKAETGNELADYPGNISILVGKEPSMVEGPQSAGFAPGQMVGNPANNINTIQYQEALDRLGTPDKQPISAYRGVSDISGKPMNPRSVLGSQSNKDADIFMSGYSPDDFAKAYSYQEMRDPREIRDAVQDAINAGHPDKKELQPLIDNFNWFDKETTQPLYKAAIDKGIVPKPGGMLQDLKVFPTKPAYLDYKGNPIFDPEGKGNLIEPEELYKSYWDKGHDAVIIDNVRDPNTSMVPNAGSPSRVIVVNPDARHIIKAKHNYGYWNTTKGNEDLLRAIPIGLTTGLGGFLNQQGDNK